MAVLIKFFIRTTLSVAETVSLDVRCFWAVPVAPRARWEDEDMVRFQGWFQARGAFTTIVAGAAGTRL